MRFAAFSLGCWTGARTGCKIIWSTCRHTETIRQEPLLMRFQPFTGQVCRHRERSSKGFRVSGRCFVVVQPGLMGAVVGSVALMRNPRQMRGDRRATQSPPKDANAGRTSRHHKASSTSGRKLTQQTGLHGPHPHSPAATTNRYSRPSVGEATGTRRARRGDRYCAQTELLHPSGHLVRTAQKRLPDGECDSPRHPAAALTRPPI